MILQIGSIVSDTAKPDGDNVSAGRTSARSPSRPTEPANNLLWQRPGFLVRRLHQIHSAMFFDACRVFGVTPLQYSLLSLLREQPGLDQGSLAWELGIDRSNTFDVVQRLKRAGLIDLKANKTDRRRKVTVLTAAGRALLVRLDPSALEAHANLLTSLTEKERLLLMRLLQKVLGAMNSVGREVDVDV